MDMRYLLLTHASMQLCGFEPTDAEHDPDSVRLLFLAEEDDHAVCVDLLAQIHQVG